MIENKPDIEMRDIPGYERLYAITRDGRVWSYPKRRNGGHKGKWLKNSAHQWRTPKVTLYKNNIKENLTTLRLVAEVYAPNIENKKVIVRKNNNIKEIHADNLEWAINAIGNVKRDRKPVNQYTLDGIFINTFSSAKNASRCLWIENSQISKCARGAAKTAGGFIWRYVD